MILRDGLSALLPDRVILLGDACHLNMDIDFETKCKWWIRNDSLEHRCDQVLVSRTETGVREKLQDCG